MSGDNPSGYIFLPGVGELGAIAKEQDRQIEELRVLITNLLIENARLKRGRTGKGRAPDTATEAFSASAMVQLQRGVAESQVYEDLIGAYRLYKVPNLQRQAKSTLALAKQRLKDDKRNE